MVFSYLQNKEAVSELFREISKKISERPGGYTRILKTGNRLGDNADMCIIELVDYNEIMLGTKEAPKAKATRRRRPSGKKKAAEGSASEETVSDSAAESKAKKPAKKTVKKAEEAEEQKAPETAEQPEAGDGSAEAKE